MTAEKTTDDLRSFIATLKSDYPRELVEITDALSGDGELAACTVGLERRMRVPVIEYTNVSDSSFTVVHNVCSSLARVARAMKTTTEALEQRLATAYDSQRPPAIVSTGPIREVVHRDVDLDIGRLPAIRYTEAQQNPYISAACVVARDSESGALNLSFNRLMYSTRNSLVIYMTPGSDLDVIFQRNCRSGCDTPVAAFIGCHPLWSLGSLASGPVSLDEYSVIGGLLGYPLEVVPGLLDRSLQIPAHAEIALEGYLSREQTEEEGPYGEAFGYVSAVESRPVFRVELMSHRQDPLFQDIVPGQMEHLTMTGVAIKVHLQKALTEQFDNIVHVFLPAPMTVYISLASGTTSSTDVRLMLRAILEQQRSVKHVVAFDEEVKIDNARQTQRNMVMHVQPDRDLVILEGQPGNGLDPSERGGKTTKWGIDATATSVSEGDVELNSLPEAAVEGIDVDAIWKRAQAAN